MVPGITGIILAGGENTRMKAPKPLVRVAGERMIDLQVAALGAVFSEVVVVGAGPDVEACPGVRFVADEAGFKDMRGPMRGIGTGLAAAGGACFVVACDMPFINPRLMSHLAERLSCHDLVIPVVGGFAEPLFGVYGYSALDVIRDTLMRGGRRIRDAFGSLDVLYVKEDELRRFDGPLHSFINVNTPADLVRAEKVAGGARPAHVCGGMPQRTY